MKKKIQHGGKRDGAGRKRKDPQVRRQTIALCLSPQLIEHLTAEAKKQGLSRSELAENYLQKNLALS